MASTAFVVDMNALAAPAPVVGQAPATANTNTTSKNNDTLFGPNIGVLGAGPEWTERPDKSEDVLTPEIVKGWIAKSKEVSPCFRLCISGSEVYATTTCQLPCLWGECGGAWTCIYVEVACQWLVGCCRALCRSRRQSRVRCTYPSSTANCGTTVVSHGSIAGSVNWFDSCFVFHQPPY